MEPALEERLAGHIAAAGFDDLDRETVSSCKKLVMDSLGVVFPGSRAPGLKELVEVLSAWQTGGGASILLSGLRTPPQTAAMANSAMMHALDFDDTLDASALHTFVTVLPAALAAAELRGGVSGKELITALVLGVDTVCRISLAIDRPLSWIRTATCGSFGAAAAAGKILGLDKDRLLNALGIVYSRTAGNAQCLIEGRLVKRIQPGFAASAGVLSALLAEKGITGSRSFLNGKYGFYELYERGECEPERVYEKLGKHSAVLDLSLKPYPSCRMTHSAVHAAAKLRERVGHAENIEKIDVYVSSMAAEMVGKPFQTGPDPQVDAQFSIPYTVACVFCRGEVFLADFEEDKILEPGVRQTAERVRVHENPKLPAKDILQCSMTASLKDGRVFTESVSYPPGNPQNPLNIEQCREKFSKCIDYSGIEFGKSARDRLIGMIEELEALPDASELVRAMTLLDNPFQSSKNQLK